MVNWMIDLMSPIWFHSQKKVWKVKDGDFIQVFSKEDQPDDILWD